MTTAAKAKKNASVAVEPNKEMPEGVAETQMPEGAPQQPQMPMRGVMIWFNFVSKEGNQGGTRVFLPGPADLRTQQDIAEVERLIVTQNTNLASAFVTNWKPLEA